MEPLVVRVSGLWNGFSGRHRRLDYRFLESLLRIAIPNANSLKIVDTSGKRNGVIIANSGATDFFIEILQNNLDGNVDSVSGLPSHGIKIAQNSAPIVIPFFVGVIYARAAVPGAQGDIWQYCADC
jgi:hypothetical protein